jgi:hypothetical protein
MKKQNKKSLYDPDDEYIQVPFDKTCHVPLIQAAKVLGLKKGDLPVIRTPVADLEGSFRWLENEKEKGYFVYNHHIASTKDFLIEAYPEIKEKLRKQFRPKKSDHKSKEVCDFVDSALILELHHMLDRLGDRPTFLNRTLH